jgi:putative redox protein
MTLAMYARRKRWPLEAVTIKLRHSKIHAADCEACETTDARIDQIERDIELTGVLSEDQRARLLEIANKCPVHRTLTSEIHIQTRLTTG